MLALRVWLWKINPRVGRGPDPALDGAGGGISESPDLFWESLKAHPIPALPKFPLGLLQTLPSQALHTARDGNSGAVLLLCEFLGGFGAVLVHQEEFGHGGRLSTPRVPAWLLPLLWGRAQGTLQGLCPAWDYKQNSRGHWAPVPVLEAARAGHRRSLQGLEEPSAP